MAKGIIAISLSLIGTLCLMCDSIWIGLVLNIISFTGCLALDEKIKQREKSSGCTPKGK